METENKIHQLQLALDNATAQLNQAKQLLSELNADELSPLVREKVAQVNQPEYEGDTQVVEGVFNGQNMVGPDGKIYTIPANYVSKSKLVEGDILKLTILSDGSFIYKQIGPVERKRLVGNLVHDSETGDYSVLVNHRAYKVIMASITYYKGTPGDEVVILVPEAADSNWAAVENIIHQGSGPEAMSEYLENNQLTELELPAGDAAELPSGEAAELPMGDAAELADGSSSELASGSTAEISNPQ